MKTKDIIINIIGLIVVMLILYIPLAHLQETYNLSKWEYGSKLLFSILSLLLFGAFLIIRSLFDLFDD